MLGKEMHERDTGSDRFSAATTALRRTLGKIPSDGVVRWPDRFRAIQGAADILGFLPICRKAHEDAVVHVMEVFRVSRLSPEEMIKELRSAAPPSPWSTPLEVCSKALLYLIRAYQDELFVLMWALLMPRAAPIGKRSMFQGAFGSKPVRPIRAFLDERAPQYEGWFLEARRLRDQVKAGVGFSSGGHMGPTADPGEIGVRPVSYTDQGGVVVDVSKPLFGLREVDRSLAITSTLVEAITAESERHTQPAM